MTLRLAAPDDEGVRHIVENMREADVEELRLIERRGPEAAVEEALRRSAEAVMAIWGGTPAAIFGVAPITVVGKYAAPWFLGTCAVNEAPRPMLVMGRYYTQRWRERFTLLENRVDARNEASRRWLERLGFHMEEPQAIHGGEVIRFWMEGRR